MPGRTDAAPAAVIGSAGPVDPEPERPEMNTNTKVRLGTAVGLAVVAMIWILQNGGSVETKFLFFTVTMPQPALLAITLLAGIVTGILLAWSLSGKWSRQKREPPTE